ncbi:MAG: hypothetical protein RTU63_08680 [Candidatus Thorarchaeota archaeon]
MQAGISNWFAQNLFLTLVILIILQVVILAIYLKFFLRIIHEGTTYRHYRKGRLLRESNKGGMILLIPFIDKFEIVAPEPTGEHTADYLEDNESD